MFRFLATAMLALVSFSALSVQANSSQDSAWFLDSSRVVRYCVSRDAGFSLSFSEIQSGLNWALLKWVSYSDSFLTERPASLRLARQFQQIDNCEQADLRFFFGVQNAEIETYKKEDFYHPVAFAKRTSVDLRAGWGRGLVWVSNDADYNSTISWRDPVKFKGVLLHELGHVFGVGHLGGTIMRETVVDQLLKASSNYELTHIPNAWELMSPAKSTWSSGAQYDELGEMSAQAFSQLVGRAPQGVIRGQWLAGQMQVLVQDDLSQYVFRVSVAFERGRISDSPLFYVYRKDSEGRVQATNARRETSIRIGVLKSLAGASLPIVLERNVADRHLHIMYQPAADQVYVPLFAQPCEMQEVPFHAPVCVPVYPSEEG